MCCLDERYCNRIAIYLITYFLYFIEKNFNAFYKFTLKEVSVPETFSIGCTIKWK